MNIEPTNVFRTQNYFYWGEFPPWARAEIVATQVGGKNGAGAGRWSQSKRVEGQILLKCKNFPTYVLRV